MGKISISDFPNVDGIYNVPKNMLEKLINSYNKFQAYEFEKRVKEKAELIRSGKSQSYTEEEFNDLLEKEGL